MSLQSWVRAARAQVEQCVPPRTLQLVRLTLLQSRSVAARARRIRRARDCAMLV